LENVKQDKWRHIPEIVLFMATAVRASNPTSITISRTPAVVLHHEPVRSSLQLHGLYLRSVINVSFYFHIGPISDPFEDF
jgi:hypothetical protein